MDLSDPRAVLSRYLQAERDALLWKLDGLGERAVRMPRTPTGTSLVGIVKHCANVEIGYFGLTFGYEWPEADDPCFVPLEAYDADPQADWYLDGEVATDQLVDFTGRVWEFADRTIDALPLDAVGHVPWWPDPREATLHHILVRVTDDLARHAGQADILREQIDSAVGQSAAHGKIPDDVDWPEYVAKLTAIAEQFPE